MNGILFILMLTVASWFSAVEAQALMPAEVLVVVNKNSQDSVELGNYYRQRRGIPEDHLVQLKTSTAETCSRKTYKQQIADPLRKFLAGKGREQIRSIVLMFGLPLKISSDEKQQTAQTRRSSVDSELALVRLQNYPLTGWLKNPLFVGFRQQKNLLSVEDVLLVARLDGPDKETVRRIIDDSITIENNGLTGRAYFDARWKVSTKNNLHGYELYDQSLHNAAKNLKQSSMMPVIVDDHPELFQDGEAPHAALYCGWYSLAKYVDAFVWQKGAIGYHLASAECSTLKRKGSQVWCKRLLEEGVAATIGPVYEPYIQGFPVPEIFFKYLTDGFYSLAEAYYLSLPYLSWQMVLIGDPLYRPFKTLSRME